ncbi:phosphoglycerate dehydrogenase [Pseudomarimonas salicorniae]|uniref:D-3-phosphoglycerate dehydrogenase n=1 Tax=Pseudomarimonas salicorniae TaxID=2933270 RepID=A0ABT0GK20_9GAMM|nr:phosphoglycerate dehydrogenase [Lysobacter sp. CAU 1642]MCK7594892.1 phosphoglycerate dehydrogenase [Lysobacter sp. CAU 1642]
MFKIQTLNNISRIGLERLPAGQYNVASDQTDPDALLVRSADLHKIEIPASVRAIGRAGAGTNNIPVAEMSKRGVPVFNAPGANANAVKELVLAGMLLSSRNIPDALAFVSTLPEHADAHHAMEAEKKRFVGSELSGKTLGVVGLGAIGVRVANAARALGMRVFGFDPHMTVDGAWQLSADVVKAGSLNELYAASDFISFHVPLNDATRGVFKAESLQVARRGVVLLNFARDGIIDAGALKAGLDDGTIGRYVTDFPSKEQAVHPRVIGLPHLGASTAEAEENCAVMVVDQLRDFLENGNVLNSVNFPNTRMAREGKARLCIANQNRPGMIGRLSQVLGEAGLNIAQMHNASRGELAYTLVDIDSPADAAALETIAAVEGILALRVV